MLTWINFLHFYQPPHQNPTLLKIITRESYQLIIELLKKHPEIKFTINFSGCLTELLAKQKKIIQGLKELVNRGQVELTASAKYHPILPLIPLSETIRQIKLNDKINQAYFGSIYQPKGFYLPEMAYTEKMAKLLKKMGYEWIILDEISKSGQLDQTDFNKKYIIENCGLEVIFRERKLSKTFVPKTILKLLNQSGPTNKKIIITATDAEMYGHHHHDWENNFKKVLGSPQLNTLTISQFIKSHTFSEEISPLESSWESTEEELQKNIPYALWSDPKNEIQQMMWQLLNLALKINNQYNIKNFQSWARRHLDRGLASCSWWWASEKKFDGLSSITWNPDEIEKGLDEIIKSIRSLITLPFSYKLEAEKLYLEIKKLIWQKHWKNYANQNLS